MNRRDFLRILGVGAATTAAGLVLPVPIAEALEPRRRFWQVPLGAPVRLRPTGVCESFVAAHAVRAQLDARLDAVIINIEHYDAKGVIEIRTPDQAAAVLGPGNPFQREIEDHFARMSAMRVREWEGFAGVMNAQPAVRFSGTFILENRGLQSIFCGEAEGNVEVPPGEVAVMPRGLLGE